MESGDKRGKMLNEYLKFSTLVTRQSCTQSRRRSRRSVRPNMDLISLAAPHQGGYHKKIAQLGAQRIFWGIVPNICDLNSIGTFVCVTHKYIWISREEIVKKHGIERLS